MRNSYILELLNNAIVKTKTIITLIGALNVLQGIGFILGGETLTKQSFPEDMLTGGAVEVGTAMHWPLGVACIVLGIILFSTRSLPLNEAKKVLLYTGFAYTFFLINGLLQHFTTPVRSTSVLALWHHKYLWQRLQLRQLKFPWF